MTVESVGLNLRLFSLFTNKKESKIDKHK
jgi:hypothetical protein